MMRLLLATLAAPILLGVVATDTANLTTTDPVAASGTEQRCTELGANCVCSEPMDFAGTDIINFADFPDSPDTSECWGTGRDGTSGAGFQTSTGTNDMVTPASVSQTTWGAATHLYQRETGFAWLNPPNVASGALAPDADVRTYCMRYYKQVTDNYSPAGSSAAGGNCDVVHTCNQNGSFFNCRNKIFQANLGDHLVQAEERSNGDCPATVGAHNNIDFFVSGPSLDSRFSPTPAVDWNDCDEAPCRLEMCIDGNIAAGTGLQVRLRVTSLEPSGPEGVASSSVFSVTGAPDTPDFWGGDIFHSGPIGSDTISHYAVGSWDTDTDQWIGPACEIEGCP